MFLSSAHCDHCGLPIELSDVGKPCDHSDSGHATAGINLAGTVGRSENCSGSGEDEHGYSSSSDGADADSDDDDYWPCTFCGAWTRNRPVDYYCCCDDCRNDQDEVDSGGNGDESESDWSDDDSELTKIWCFACETHAHFRLMDSFRCELCFGVLQCKDCGQECESSRLYCNDCLQERLAECECTDCGEPSDVWLRGGNRGTAAVPSGWYCKPCATNALLVPAVVLRPPIANVRAHRGSPSVGLSPAIAPIESSGTKRQASEMDNAEQNKRCKASLQHDFPSYCSHHLYFRHVRGRKIACTRGDESKCDKGSHEMPSRFNPTLYSDC